MPDPKQFAGDGLPRRSPSPQLPQTQRKDHHRSDSSRQTTTTPAGAAAVAAPGNATASTSSAEARGVLGAKKSKATSSNRRHLERLVDVTGPSTSSKTSSSNATSPSTDVGANERDQKHSSSSGATGTAMTRAGATAAADAKATTTAAASSSSKRVRNGIMKPPSASKFLPASSPTPTPPQALLEEIQNFEQPLLSRADLNSHPDMLLSPRSAPHIVPPARSAYRNGGGMSPRTHRIPAGAAGAGAGGAGAGAGGAGAAGGPYPRSPHSVHANPKSHRHVLPRKWMPPSTLNAKDVEENQPIKVAFLDLKKSGSSLGSQFKRRWALLTKNSFAFVKPNKKGVPTDSICLMNATVRIVNKYSSLPAPLSGVGKPDDASSSTAAASAPPSPNAVHYGGDRRGGGGAATSPRSRVGVKSAATSPRTTGNKHVQRLYQRTDYEPSDSATTDSEQHAPAPKPRSVTFAHPHHQHNASSSGSSASSPHSRGSGSSTGTNGSVSGATGASAGGLARVDSMNDVQLKGGTVSASRSRSAQHLSINGSYRYSVQSYSSQSLTYTSSSQLSSSSGGSGIGGGGGGGTVANGKSPPSVNFAVRKSLSSTTLTVSTEAAAATRQRTTSGGGSTPSSPSLHRHNSVGSMTPTRASLHRNASSPTVQISPPPAQRANSSSASHSKTATASGSTGGPRPPPTPPPAETKQAQARWHRDRSSSKRQKRRRGGSSNDCCLIIDAELWTKRGKVHHSPRTFFVRTSSRAELRDWYAAVQRVMDTHEEFLEKHPLFARTVEVDEVYYDGGGTDADEGHHHRHHGHGHHRASSGGSAAGIVAGSHLSPPHIGVGGNGAAGHHPVSPTSNSAGSAGSLSAADHSGTPSSSYRDGETPPRSPRQSGYPGSSGLTVMELISAGLGSLKKGGMSQTEMRETLRTLHRMCLDGQFDAPPPVQEPDSIAQLLEESDLDFDTKRWLQREYTRPGAFDQNIVDNFPTAAPPSRHGGGSHEYSAAASAIVTTRPHPSALFTGTGVAALPLTLPANIGSISAPASTTSSPHAQARKSLVMIKPGSFSSSNDAAAHEPFPAIPMLRKTTSISAGSVHSQPAAGEGSAAAAGSDPANKLAMSHSGSLAAVSPYFGPLSAAAAAATHHGSPASQAAVAFLFQEHLREVIARPMPQSDIDDLANWNWNVFKYEAEELFPYLIKMFDHFNFLEMYRIRPPIFVKFLCAVRDKYHDIPYHNFYHAVDVCQTVYTVLVSLGGSAYLSSLQKFAILIAALVHDLDHPGQNNVFQVNASTELAILYNDQSVLENHHCYAAFDILSDPKTNILAGLGKQEYRKVRKTIISAVLATDMTCHFDLLKKFNQRVECHWTDGSVRGNAAPPKNSSSSLHLNQSDRELVISVLLHSADISNPCKSWANAIDWSTRIQEEFCMQGDLEKKNQLPVSPNSDRQNMNQAVFSLNFIDFIVAPMFVSVTQFLPKLIVSTNNMRSNRKKWYEIHAENFRKGHTCAEEAEEKKKWERRHDSFRQVLAPVDPSLNQRKSSHQRKDSLRKLFDCPPLNIDLSSPQRKSVTTRGRNGGRDDPLSLPGRVDEDGGGGNSPASQHRRGGKSAESRRNSSPTLPSWKRQLSNGDRTGNVPIKLLRPPTVGPSLGSGGFLPHQRRRDGGRGRHARHAMSHDQGDPSVSKFAARVAAAVTPPSADDSAAAGPNQQQQQHLSSIGEKGKGSPEKAAAAAGSPPSLTKARPSLALAKVNGASGGSPSMSAGAVLARDSPPSSPRVGGLKSSGGLKNRLSPRKGAASRLREGSSTVLSRDFLCESVDRSTPDASSAVGTPRGSVESQKKAPL